MLIYVRLTNAHNNNMQFDRQSNVTLAQRLRRKSPSTTEYSILISLTDLVNKSKCIIISSNFNKSDWYSALRVDNFKTNLGRLFLSHKYLPIVCIRKTFFFLNQTI